MEKLWGWDPLSRTRSGPTSAEKGVVDSRRLSNHASPNRGCGDEESPRTGRPLSGLVDAVAVVASPGGEFGDEDSLLRENLVVVAPAPMPLPPGGDPPGVSRGLPSSCDVANVVLTPTPYIYIYICVYKSSSVNTCSRGTRCSGVLPEGSWEEGGIFCCYFPLSCFSPLRRTRWPWTRARA